MYFVQIVCDDYMYKQFIAKWRQRNGKIEF